MAKPSQILSETTIALARVPSILPDSVRSGGRLHRATAFRWAFEGRLSRAGVRIKLEAVRLGHSWFTSKEAVERFCDALNDMPGELPPIRSKSQREKAAERAGRELEKMGI